MWLKYHVNSVTRQVIEIPKEKVLKGNCYLIDNFRMEQATKYHESSVFLCINERKYSLSSLYFLRDIQISVNIVPTYRTDRCPYSFRCQYRLHNIVSMDCERGDVFTIRGGSN